MCNIQQVKLKAFELKKEAKSCADSEEFPSQCWFFFWPPCIMPSQFLAHQWDQARP